MKINWESLPHDVLYVAQNKSSEWVGFRAKPIPSEVDCWNSADIKETCYLVAGAVEQPNELWKLTLQVRPNRFFERSNLWFKKTYPGLEGYEVRAMSDELFFSTNTDRDFFEDFAGEDLKLTIAAPDYVYGIARKNAKEDLIILIPKDI